MKSFRLKRDWALFLVFVSLLVLVAIAMFSAQLSVLAGPAPIEMVTEIKDPATRQNVRGINEWIRAHKDSATAHHDNCIVRADTLSPCLHDTLVIDFYNVFLRDSSDFVATGLHFFEMGPDSGSVRLVAADTMTGSYQLGFPDTIGRAAQLLLYNGTDFLYWRDSADFANAIPCGVEHDTVADCGSNALYLSAPKIHLIDTGGSTSVLVLHNHQDSSGSRDIQVSIGITSTAGPKTSTDWEWRLPDTTPGGGAAHYVMGAISAGGIMTTEWFEMGSSGLQLVQQGTLVTVKNKVADTVALEWPYQGVSAYNVSLTWGQWSDEGMDSLWIEQSVGQMYKADSFIVWHESDAVLRIFWMASGIKRDIRLE